MVKNTSNANSIQSSLSTNTIGNTMNLIVGVHDWIVDQGATNHMTSNPNMPVQKKPHSLGTPNQVDLPNNRS